MHWNDTKLKYNILFLLFALKLLVLVISTRISTSYNDLDPTKESIENYIYVCKFNSIILKYICHKKNWKHLQIWKFFKIDYFEYIIVNYYVNQFLKFCNNPDMMITFMIYFSYCITCWWQGIKRFHKCNAGVITLD